MEPEPGAGAGAGSRSREPELVPEPAASTGAGAGQDWTGSTTLWYTNEIFGVHKYSVNISDPDPDPATEKKHFRSGKNYPDTPHSPYVLFL